MAFAVTPAYGAAPRASLPGPWLQILSGGVAVGEPDVAVIDFVSNPETCVVTRGVGENSHVITIRYVAALISGAGGMGPPDDPFGLPTVSVDSSKPPGWMTDILDSGSTPLHANDGIGSYQDFISPPGVTINHQTYAGIEGYAGETIVWVPTWTPTVSDPSPTITPLSGGRVEVYWDTIGGGWPKTSQGLLTLAVTVNGSPAPETIEMDSGPGGDYTRMAWGPTP